jgi:hypothetical protein
MVAVMQVRASMQIACRRKLLANAEKKKGMISDTPFKMSSPMKKSTGLGDFNGTLQGKVEYIAVRTLALKLYMDLCCKRSLPRGTFMDDSHTCKVLYVQGNPEMKLKKGDTPAGKPNVYTSPGKKGTYGYIKTTLSERFVTGGLQGEYKHPAEPYDVARHLEAEEAKKKALKICEASFIPTNPPKKGTYGYSKINMGNKAAGVVGEYGYQLHNESGPCKSKMSHQREHKFETPFVSSRFPRKGYNCTINKFPEYYAEPDQLKHDARRQARKMEMAAMASANPWHPSSGPKMAATRSVVRMNI